MNSKKRVIAISSGALARALSVSQPTVRSWIKSGLLPAVVTDSARYFEIDATCGRRPRRGVLRVPVSALPGFLRRVMSGQNSAVVRQVTRALCGAGREYNAVGQADCQESGRVDQAGVKV